MQIKPSLFFHLVCAPFFVGLSSQAPAGSDEIAANTLPVRTIAGVTVVNTPLVRDAQALARKYSSDYVYKHIMRSWLFGALILQHNETLRQTVDLEAHAVSAILHDLGWDENSPFISLDKRFEVDGAVAATDFLKSSRNSQAWDVHRLQLVWDSIALHSQPSIANYKEPTVAVVSEGILFDLSIGNYGVTADEVAGVLSEFPRTGLASGFNSTMIWLCQTKPATTYDTWQQPWGDHFVANYSSAGKTLFDLLETKA